MKLCIYLNNGAGERAVFGIPAGYGVQRSSGYNCDDFSRYSAQDYFWLYPGDPSGLDADNDGAPCEENAGPAPGPQIPPEPLPTPQRDVTCTDGIDNDGDGPLDLNDFDWDTSSYSPAGAKCDQINANPDGDADDPTTQPARPKPVRLLCNKFVGRRGRNVAYRTRAPRRCNVWRANWAHYRALTFIRGKWTRWGKPTARARVTITSNSGYRARARIKAYRLRRDCTRNYCVYTRVALLPGGKRKRTIIFKPIHLSGLARGTQYPPASTARPPRRKTAPSTVHPLDAHFSSDLSVGRDLRHHASRG
jgi:hypothetical protein